MLILLFRILNMKFRNLVKFSAVPALILVSASAMAVDTAAVTSAITDAVTDGSAVGVAVIGGVASLIVVGVVISMVKKLTA